MYGFIFYVAPGKLRCEQYAEFSSPELNRADALGLFSAETLDAQTSGQGTICGKDLTRAFEVVAAPST
jgi:hypothetical protein